MKNSLSPLDLLDRILEGSGYHAYIDDGSEEGEDRWDNVVELRRLAAEYQEAGLEIFLEQDFALVSDQDTIDASANVPTLLTLHAAKGLEFRVVLIVGLNDQEVFPHSRSFDDPEGMMEERRAASTSASPTPKTGCIWSIRRTANSYGYLEPVDPSRFLGDLPRRSDR